MSSSNNWSIAQKIFIYQGNKVVQKYVHLVEEEKIWHKKESSYIFCCLLRTLHWKQQKKNKHWRQSKESKDAFVFMVDEGWDEAWEEDNEKDSEFTNEWWKVGLAC